jgi:hypothetical protein
VKDGLYRVCYKNICAGFIVENGKVTRCAPILLSKIEYWKTIAVWISEAKKGEVSHDIARETREF